MGNVVEFEVEKHTVSLIHKAAHERGSFGREQRAANLDSAHFVSEPEGELCCVNGVIDVESD
jgi:hypothetical protein